MSVGCGDSLNEALERDADMVIRHRAQQGVALSWDHAGKTFTYPLTTNILVSTEVPFNKGWFWGDNILR